MEIPNIYRGNYKLLLIPPLLLILLSVFFIPKIQLGVDFKGGTLITLVLKEKIDAATLTKQLESEGLKADVKVFDTALGYKAEIEVPQDDKLVKADGLKTRFSERIPNLARLEVNRESNDSNTTDYATVRNEVNEIVDEMLVLDGKPATAAMFTNPNQLEKEFYASYNDVFKSYRDSISKPIEKFTNYSSISIQTVSPLLSTRFIEKAGWVVVMSAVLSTIFVFAFFRVVMPSIAVVVGAASDVTIALGAMGLLGIPFTLPSLAALLMLIGFSLDTDVLLTMRILKREGGDNREKAFDAMKTGTTMSLAAVVAFGVLFILASVTHIPTYYEISAVALAGLVGDMFATWGINAVMLLWYVERKVS